VPGRKPIGASHARSAPGLGSTKAEARWDRLSFRQQDDLPKCVLVRGIVVVPRTLRDNCVLCRVGAADAVKGPAGHGERSGRRAVLPACDWYHCSCSPLPARGPALHWQRWIGRFGVGITTRLQAACSLPKQVFLSTAGQIWHSGRTRQNAGMEAPRAKARRARTHVSGRFSLPNQSIVANVFGFCRSLRAASMFFFGFCRAESGTTTADRPGWHQRLAELPRPWHGRRSTAPAMSGALGARKNHREAQMHGAGSTRSASGNATFPGSLPQ